MIHPEDGRCTFVRNQVEFIFMQAIPFCYLPNKLHLHRPTQHRFIVIAPYVYATYFGPFSGHIQACQYKNRLKEDTIK